MRTERVERQACRRWRRGPETADLRTGCGRARLDDLERRDPGEGAGGDRATVETVERAASGLAQVERELVHVHVDERGAAADVEPATEAERVADRLVLVVERGLDAGAEAVAHRA